jgi:putative transposase
MSHTYVQNVLHVVFSTKNRGDVIPEDFRRKLWTYVGGICRKQGIFCHAIGGMGDHLHLLIQVPADLTVGKTVNLIKSNSSKWMKQRVADFAWQEGYAAFSVSASLAPAAARYIEQQDAHHRRMDFGAELIALLKKHGVEYDPRFVFG